MERMMAQFKTDGAAAAGAGDGAAPTGPAFMSSGSILAKVAFALMAVIVSILVFRVGIYVLAWSYAPQDQPFLVNGLHSGNAALTIPQDDSLQDGVRILRSNNQESGMECTYSCWININNIPLNMSMNKCLHVFNKGTLRDQENMVLTKMQRGASTAGGAAVMDSPGLYIARSAVKNMDGTDVTGTDIATQAKIVVCMSTTMTSDNKPSVVTIEVDNIPQNKWIHVAIRLLNTALDIYVNGSIAKRHVFTDTVPLQSFGDIHVCQHGGFNGNISNLQYFDRGLSIFAIQSIVARGPKMVASNQERESGKPGTSNFFLGNDWYTTRF
jgi:hypothetical protein